MMLRALSTRRSTRGYERLGDESTVGLLQEGKLKRAPSLPAKVFASSGKFTLEFTILEEPSKLMTKSWVAPPPPPPPVKKAKKAKKVHPLFSLFDSKKKSKTTAKPEFARYLEYLKEGGVWDNKSNIPVIHYK